MPAILYRDPNFEGPSVRLPPGFYSGRRDLEGRVRGASSGEDLDDQASSIRVDAGYVAVLYSDYSPTPGGQAGGARVLIGPAEVPDLGAVGMDDKTSSVRVLAYEQYRAAPPGAGATLFGHAHPGANAPGGIRLGPGDYSRARLDSDEVSVGPGGIRALCAGPDVIVILYEGNSFESTSNSTVVLPGECVNDTYDLRMVGAGGSDPGINSVRVLHAPAGAAPPAARPAVVPAARPAPPVARRRWGRPGAPIDGPGRTRVKEPRSSGRGHGQRTWALWGPVLLILVLTVALSLALARSNSSSIDNGKTRPLAGINPKGLEMQQAPAGRAAGKFYELINS